MSEDRQWFAHGIKRDGFATSCVTLDDDQEIAQSGHARYVVAEGVSGNDARLIAAAPDLLAAAIKTVQENLHLADGDDCTLRHLKAAIAKAKGGDSTC